MMAAIDNLRGRKYPIELLQSFDPEKSKQISGRDHEAMPANFYLNGLKAR